MPDAWTSPARLDRCARIPAAFLRCPVCRGVLDPGVAGAFRCPSCGVSAIERGGRMLDFLDATQPEDVARIWAWREELVRDAAAWPRERIDGIIHSPRPDPDLEAEGVVDADGRLTRLGAALCYQLGEHERQLHACQFLPAEVLDTIGPTSDVIDVGCGAGQSLRHLAGRRPRLSIGVDSDLTSLAIGCRLGAADPASLHLVRASACALPFADASFSHVVCRVALNYMHQRTALDEMVRVLARGGVLYLHVEGPGFDVQHGLAARGTRQLACRARDLALGVVLATVGRQAAPGAVGGGGRLFGSARRITRWLGGVGWERLDWEVTERAFGLPVGLRLVAWRGAVEEGERLRGRERRSGGAA